MQLPGNNTFERTLIGLAIGGAVLFAVVSMVVSIANAPRQARERAVAEAKAEEDAKARAIEDKKKKEEAAAEKAQRDAVDDKIGAWTYATVFVERFLKSPSTADYGSVFGGTYQDPDKCVTALGDYTYRVKGWVDSQNGFGATVRSDFVVTLRDKGDSWELVEPPVIEQR